MDDRLFELHKTAAAVAIPSALGALMAGGAAGHMASGVENENETADARRKRIRDQIVLAAALGAATGAGTGVIYKQISKQPERNNPIVSGLAAGAGGLGAGLGASRVSNLIADSTRSLPGGGKGLIPGTTRWLNRNFNLDASKDTIKRQIRNIVDTRSMSNVADNQALAAALKDNDAGALDTVLGNILDEKKLIGRGTDLHKSELSQLLDSFGLAGVKQRGSNLVWDSAAKDRLLDNIGRTRSMGGVKTVGEAEAAIDALLGNRAKKIDGLMDQLGELNSSAHNLTRRTAESAHKTNIRGRKNPIPFEHPGMGEATTRRFARFQSGLNDDLELARKIIKTDPKLMDDAAKLSRVRQILGQVSDAHVNPYLNSVILDSKMMGLNPTDIDYMMQAVSGKNKSLYKNFGKYDAQYRRAVRPKSVIKSMAERAFLGSADAKAQQRLQTLLSKVDAPMKAVGDQASKFDTVTRTVGKHLSPYKGLGKMRTGLKLALPTGAALWGSNYIWDQFRNN